MLGPTYLWHTRAALRGQLKNGVLDPQGRAIHHALEGLGFAGVQNNVLYCNNSRGKFEAMLLSVCGQVMLDLSRLAADVILWSLPEFGYFRLPADQCPGSSLMPNSSSLWRPLSTNSRLPRFWASSRFCIVTLSSGL